MSRLRCGSASWDGGCWHRTWTDTLHCDKRCSCDGGRVGRWRHSATVSERSLIRADKRERRMCCKLISHRHSWVYSVSRMWVFLNRNVLQGGVVSTSPNTQAGGPTLVGCPRLLIQYIRSYPPHRRPFLHPQPEDAPCRDDRNPLITWYERYQWKIMPLKSARYCSIRDMSTAWQTMYIMQTFSFLFNSAFPPPQWKNH